MGDKSPKSKNKDNKQKVKKAATAENEKQKTISDKQQSRVAQPKKKK